MKKTLVLAAAMAMLATLPVDAQNVWVQKKDIRTDAASGAWLGIAVSQTVTQKNDEPTEREIKVAKVFEDSPAEAAGFQAGDLLISIDGTTVRDSSQFVDAIRSHATGDTVTFVVSREGREITLNARLGERPEDFRFMLGNDMSWSFNTDGDDMHVLHLDKLKELEGQLKMLHLGDLGDAEVLLKNAMNCEEDGPCVMQLLHGSARPKLGVRVEPLTKQLAEYFRADGGLLVTEVIEGSAAEKAGIQAGDVITGVDAAQISSVSQLREALSAVELPGTVRVEVLRRGRARSLDANLEAPEEQEGGAYNMRFMPRQLDKGNRLKI